MVNKYIFGGMEADSIELKCLLISRGINVDSKIYKTFSKNKRVYPNPLMCNSIILPDGTIVQMTDLSFHFSYLKGALSWDNLKLLKYASQMKSPFSLTVNRGIAELYYNNDFICTVDFHDSTDFYKEKTSSGLPFIGNAVIQGAQWIAFQCLWPCEYACAGEPCEFCYSGGVFESLTLRKKPLPAVPSADDVGEIVKYAVENAGCDSIQITGGSTFKSEKESKYISAYLGAVNSHVGKENLKGEILLYITPPDNVDVIDDYFTLGADRIACSIDVWDEKCAERITPGKYKFTGRKRHIDALSYIADKHGPGKAFSNLIIGLESFDTFKEGAVYLAERGIIPSASIWIPFGRPVMNSMATPDLDYYRKVKELLAELYTKYNLEPAGGKGLNVCIERDVWRYAKNA